MADAKDIQTAVNGAFHSAIGQKAHDGTAWRTMKGGTHVRRGNQWDIYREAMNAQITLGLVSGTSVSIAFKSLPSAPFRPQGIYHANKQVMTVQVKLTGEIRFTDGTSDAYIYTAGPFACDGQSHTVTDTASIPSGKTAYQITNVVADITLNGYGPLAYKPGTITVTSEPMRFTADAFTYPAGAGTAIATPSNPTYGQIVTFTAQDTVSGRTFTKWRESGKTARAYSVQVFGNIRDTAEFADTSKTVNFRIRAYIDVDHHICVDAKTLQNRIDQFVMVSFDIGYTDTSGMPQTLRYEREVWLNGQIESHTFDQTASSLNAYTPPEVGILPESYVLGSVEVTLDNVGPFMAESLKAGYSPWEVTADDDDI